MQTRKYVLVLITLLFATLACSIPSLLKETSLPLEAIQETVIAELMLTPQPETLEPEPTPEVPTEEPRPETPTEEPIPEIPIEEPTPEDFTCSPGMALGNAFGVEFCYPQEDSGGYSQEMIPEKTESEEMFPWSINPQFIEIILTGYHVKNEYHAPAIRVYPVADFVALDSYVQTIVDDIQTLLASGDPRPSSVPFVPFFNAGQMICSQVTYLDFRNGNGVRFITQYGQAFAPISNDAVIYAFIGLTDDGKYLLSATMPIKHLMFVDSVYDDPPEGWNAFIDNYENYRNNMETMMLAMAPETFGPSLLSLDKMMESFLIPVDAIP